MEKMKLQFKDAEKFEIGLQRLQNILNYELSENGLEVDIVQSDDLGASLKDGKGTIFYKEKAHFFRALGLFVQHAAKKKEFCVKEKISFDTMGFMFYSAGANILTTDAFCRFLDYLVVMGYNMVMMYTEDAFKVKNRPFFGYMRGHYTEQELRMFDDYAYDYGIEMIPCIEAYGHMGEYLRWREAKNVKDTERVLLAEEEETFALVEEMIRSISAPFRSKRIHIGMDEAMDMGRGAYLDKHGYTEPFAIFKTYMERLINIVKKYDLQPMIWSDMYFRIASPSGKAYYGEDIIVTEELKKSIPEDVQLVFWHYGEEPGCDDYMLKKHLSVGKDIIFAGGLWDWSSVHVPEYHYAFEATEASIEACKKNGIREMMMTSWGRDVSLYANLLGLSYAAEMAYQEKPSEEHFRKRFEICTGGNYDAFWDMSAYNNIFDEGRVYEKFPDRFFGAALFWQDILEGLYDANLYIQPMSEHYGKYAKKMADYDGKWSELYRHTEKLFAYLHTKTLIAEMLKPAYDRKDTKTLALIAEELLPRLLEQTQEVQDSHYELWHSVYKGFGWSCLDAKYGRVIARTKTAIKKISAYLNGDLGQIDELEEPRLLLQTSAFAVYPNNFLVMQ